MPVSNYSPWKVLPPDVLVASSAFRPLVALPDNTVRTDSLPRLLHDSHTRACSDSLRARQQHLPGARETPDAAARLDPHPILALSSANRLDRRHHRPHVLNARAAAVEAGRRLDAVDSSESGERSRRHDVERLELRGLKDELDGGVGRGAAEGGELSEDVVVLVSEELRVVDDNVELGGAGGDSGGGLPAMALVYPYLDSRRRCSLWAAGEAKDESLLYFLLCSVGAFVEANDTSHANAAALEVGDGTGNPVEADADSLRDIFFSNHAKPNPRLQLV